MRSGVVYLVKRRSALTELALCAVHVCRSLANASSPFFDYILPSFIICAADASASCTSHHSAHVHSQAIVSVVLLHATGSSKAVIDLLVALGTLLPSHPPIRFMIASSFQSYTTREFGVQGRRSMGGGNVKAAREVGEI